MSLMRFARLGQQFVVPHFLGGVILTALLSMAPGCSTSDPEVVDKSDDSDDSDDPSTSLPAPDGGTIEVVFGGEGVACGEERCLDAQIVGLPVGAFGCCVDADEATCGLNMESLGLAIGLKKPGCEELNKPGSASDSCPESEPVMLSSIVPNAPPDGIVLTSCCQANGTCGFSADFGGVGFGCVDPSRFGQESGGSCDYEP